jgi:hypothetical protein
MQDAEFTFATETVHMAQHSEDMMSDNDPNFKSNSSDRKRAEKAFLDYLVSQNVDPIQYWFRVVRFCDSAWFVFCAFKDCSPTLSWNHVIHENEEVEELSAESLSRIFEVKYSKPINEVQQNRLIDRFIAMHSEFSPSVINSTSDIHGYDHSPLDPDTSILVREPFSFGNRVDVVYTYQLIGGIVGRYRFTFADGELFNGASYLEIGHGIGYAQYLY